MSTIWFLGDVYLKDKNYEIDIPNPYIVNLEYVLSSDNLKPITNKINLIGDNNFEGFTTLPLAVNLANNHIMDYGDLGFLNTLDILSNLDIKYFGAGCEEDNFNNPCLINICGKKVAFLGYSDVYHILDTDPTNYTVARPTKEQIINDINICNKNKVDAIIVNIHWGREERPWHNKKQEKLGRLFIDQGADIVIGHHPHCIQPVELYKGRYICYSLGNSFFPDISTPAYFRSDGTSEFVMYKKHFKYGINSLLIEFDLHSKTIKTIYKAQMKNNRFAVGNSVKHNEIVPRIFSNRFLNNSMGYFRMLCLILRSNFAVDGKVFNYKVIKKEIEIIKKRIWGSKI